MSNKRDETKAVNKRECEELKKENMALKQEIKDLKRQLNTYNMHFAQGKVK